MNHLIGAFSLIVLDLHISGNLSFLIDFHAFILFISLLDSHLEKEKQEAVGGPTIDEVVLQATPGPEIARWKVSEP